MQGFGEKRPGGLGEAEGVFENERGKNVEAMLKVENFQS